MPRRSAEPTPRGSAVGAGGWDPLRDALYGSAGLLALLSYGLSGHALSSPTAWTLLVIVVHVVAAGIWLGGVVALAGLSWRGGVRPLDLRVPLATYMGWNVRHEDAGQGGEFVSPMPGSSLPFPRTRAERKSASGELSTATTFGQAARALTSLPTKSSVG